MNFQDRIKQLEDKIEASYTEGVTLDQAEKLAGEFLHAGMQVSAQLKSADLDARMRKSGVKAIRAAIYLSEVQKSDKKPSDVLLGNTVDSNELVNKEQESLDKAEASRDELERLFNVFNSAHVYFRQLSRGSMG